MSDCGPTLPSLSAPRLPLGHSCAKPEPPALELGAQSPAEKGGSSHCLRNSNCVHTLARHFLHHMCQISEWGRTGHFVHRASGEGSDKLCEGTHLGGVSIPEPPA